MRAWCYEPGIKTIQLDSTRNRLQIHIKLQWRFGLFNVDTGVVTPLEGPWVLATDWHSTDWLLLEINELVVAIP